MKRIILACLLLSTPALADGPVQAPSVTASEKACQIMFDRERDFHQKDIGTALQMQDQITDLTKQVTALTKERDALKSVPDAGK